MNVITKLNNYIKDNDYKITYFKNYIDVSNYIEIKEFSSNKIVVKYKNGINIINGSNLVISKMLDNEILISGEINNIEFR